MAPWQWCVPNLSFPCWLIFNDAHYTMITEAYPCIYTHWSTQNMTILYDILLCFQFYYKILPLIRLWQTNGFYKFQAYNYSVFTVYPKKYAHGFCFAVLCYCYTLTDFPISTRLTSLALWQSNDCPSAGKATLMNMDKYFTWNHYARLHNHNKSKHNKTVCIFIGINCIPHWHQWTASTVEV